MTMVVMTDDHRISSAPRAGGTTSGESADTAAPATAVPSASSAAPDYADGADGDVTLGLDLGGRS